MKALINVLKRLFPVKTYLLVMGVLTTGAGLFLATQPDVAAPSVLILPIEATGESGALDYQPLFQHWGILLALVGGLMIAAASNQELEKAAMAISGVEKLFIAILGGYVFDGAFVTDLVLTIDSAGAMYSLGYFGFVVMKPFGK